MVNRQSTGVVGLDELLEGGLLPGRLTVVVGATGIGKTQLGVQYAAAGLAAEGRRGVFFDMSIRGDVQGHAEYARRIFGWPIAAVEAEKTPDLSQFFDQPPPGEYLHIFEHHGRRLTRDQADFYTWHQWQAQLNERLHTAIAFLYGHLVHGVRRVVVDGIEPVERPSDSIQFELFEYVYHQILRKEPEWVARDLFRQDYRRFADAAAARAYDEEQVGCLLLVTSREVMLEELISRPIDEGDMLSGANTVIYLGKIRRGDRLVRALCIAKHRSSDCDERIVPFSIDEQGLRVGE
jgi:KaiC/GvpD/RAD55 family RecA-like ATPase